MLQPVCQQCQQDDDKRQHLRQWHSEPQSLVAQQHRQEDEARDDEDNATEHHPQGGTLGLFDALIETDEHHIEREEQETQDEIRKSLASYLVGRRSLAEEQGDEHIRFTPAERRDDQAKNHRQAYG